MRTRRRFVVVLRLLGRGVSHRRGIAALILLVAVIASASAAVAPVYRSSAAVSALRSRMVTASPDETGVEVSGAAWPGDSPDVTLGKEVPRLPLSSAAIPGLAVGGPTTQLESHDGPVEFAALVWRQNDCRHVVFTAGQCPSGPHDIALPADAAQDLKVALGGSVVASNLARPLFPPTLTITNHVAVGKQLNPNATQAFQLNDKVVGIFEVPPSQSTYWFGADPGAAVVSPDGTQVTTVTALVPRTTLTGLPLPYRATVTIDQPLDWSNATPAQAKQVLRDVNSLRASLPSNLLAFTSIPSLLREDSADRVRLNRLVTLAQLQLLLLVGLVLIAVLASSMERRRPELVIATLQGRHPRSTALSIAAEPVLLLALGIVPGLLVSIPLAKLASHLWLRPGSPVHLTAGSLFGALLVTAIAAVVTVGIGYVAASRKLSDQLTEDARSAGGRSGAWIDLIAITLAAAGLIELFSTKSNSSSSSTPWSLLAPSLCGLAAGIGLGRLVPASLRPLLRSTAESAKLGRFLAIRELRRDRAAWRVSAMVALALSLLTFAVTINRGASADRVDRAGLIVGASRVAIVQLPPGDSLMQEVDKADPKGQWAMAGVLLDTLGSDAQRTLAVDTTRLAAVAGWTRPIDGLNPTGIKHLLHVKPAVARLAVPLLTAGDVGGSTFGLNNQPLTRSKVTQTSLLPQLLNAGALADLSSMIAVAKPVSPADLGTTQLFNQVWLGPRAPPDALTRLKAAGLTVVAVTSRAQVAQGLERLAETAGLSGYLAVAVIAAILAIALLIGTSAAGASRLRTETLALTSAGVSRSTVVRGRAEAAAVRLGLVGIVAFASGIVTAHLSVALIPEASPGAVPAPKLPLPLGPGLIAVIITVVPALIAEVAIASYAAKRTDAASLRAAMP
ncbi:MAG TPA: FtsX-like permease family protein [Mycobacteriales bacterium]|nr:FtsX-like permease family protein [Mycobacteriales bacterium]